ncbi:2OG-Fe(II) oxygenase [Calothrix sp. FACHB-1219]|uniref:prolyl hydroxylase family protein n=1 Tax=unclassified Calothrix TaxID=2619626 RepID=UPI001685DB50|nr:MULTISPECIES: 2OG-Fe(II) oxygenase [unclassified Calothrix]MBD2207623.1 2OG-Fe(II) oxygenase [Calothrix sp. FACHB-168]MBD2222224.1 2OG-Fe(II) oxygenase [Calothrix sp. FACHB-1219]
MTKKNLLGNEIFTLDNILSPEECAEYITLTENIGYTDAPITTIRGFEIRPDIRNNQRVILDVPERAFDLWQRVSNYIPSTMGRWQAVGLNERFRFYRYDPGQRFALHHDGSYQRPNGEESLLTFMIYLNEGFDGGETRFHLSPRYYEHLPTMAVVPVTGMALCFVHELVHEGAPVIQGRKYVLRSDVMYRQLSKVY